MIELKIASNWIGINYITLALTNKWTKMFSLLELRETNKFVWFSWVLFSHTVSNIFGFQEISCISEFHLVLSSCPLFYTTKVRHRCKTLYTTVNHRYNSS